MQFAIFRVGERKFKNIKELKHYQRHMMREGDIINANPDMLAENITLIGDGDIIKDVEEYTHGIKMRKNGVLAREILMTASPEWVKNADTGLMNDWINSNLEWLEEEFGDNLRHLVLHADETTLHLHGLVVPRFSDSKKGYVLANSRYFDGAVKLSEFQDRYSAAMEHLGLERGLKWSKATHTKIRTYYTLVNKELDTKDIKSVVAKAVNSEILEKKIRELNQTLNSYRNFNAKNEDEKKQLYNNYIQATGDKELLKECIRHMSDLYKIPQNHIIGIMKSIGNNIKQSEGEIEYERVRGKDSERS